MQRRLWSILLLCSILLVGACGVLPGASPAASNQDVEATVDAQVQATMAAQEQPTEPTAATEPIATEEAAATDQPTAPEPTEETTTEPFAPSAEATDETATDTATQAPDQTSATSATSDGGDTSSASDADPLVFEPTSAEQDQPIINIELVFDASGSMAEDIGGETKIEAARQAINGLIDELPADLGVRLNVGFRVFGHKGDNTDAGKAESCQSTENLVPIAGVNKDLLRQQASAWEPTGWTPISLALQQAGENLQAGENARNIIIMVTDGEETCDGDPCAVSQALAQSEANVRIDVVGFGLEPDVADTLQCIPENTGGTYNDAQDGDALAQTLQTLTTDAIKRSYLRIIAVGPDGQPVTGNDITLKGFVTDEQGQRAVTLSGEQAEFRSPNGSTDRAAPLSDNGETRLELVPGTYTFTVFYPVNKVDTANGQSDITYTAIVAEGQETVANIGIGGLALTDTTGGAVDPCLLVLEQNIAGEWINVKGPGRVPCPLGQRLSFEEPAQLAVGTYRLRNAESDDVSEFTIEPGKTVTIEVGGTR